MRPNAILAAYLSTMQQHDVAIMAEMTRGMSNALGQVSDSRLYGELMLFGSTGRDARPNSSFERRRFYGPALQ